MKAIWVLKSPYFFLEPRQLVAVGANIYMPEIAVVSLKENLLTIDFRYDMFMLSNGKKVFKNQDVVLSACTNFQLEDLTIPMGIHPCGALLSFDGLVNDGDLAHTIRQVARQLAESAWEKVLPKFQPQPKVETPQMRMYYTYTQI